MATHISYLLSVSKTKKKHNLKGLFCGGAKLDLEIQNKFFKNIFFYPSCTTVNPF